MADHRGIAGRSQEQFRQVAKAELSAFEQRENDFKREERAERAALLNLPLMMKPRDGS